MGNRRFHNRAAIREILAVAALSLALTSGCANPPWPWNSHGSSTSNPVSSESKPSPPSTPKPWDSQSNADALKQVMSDLQQVGAIDPAAREELMNDLKQVDPSRWPMILQTFRAEVAYKRREEQREIERQKEATTAMVTGREDRGKPPTTATEHERRLDLTSSAAQPLPGVSVAGEKDDSALAIAPRPGPMGVVNPDDQCPSSPERPLDGGSVPAAESNSGRIANRPPNVPTAADDLPLHRNGGISTIAEIAGKPGEAVAGRAEPLTAAEQLAAIRREATAAAVVPAGFTTSGAAASLADADWQTHLTAAIRAIERESKAGSSQESDVALQARLRMLYLLAGHRDEAMRPLPAAPQAAQDYWSSQIYGLSTWMDTEKTPDMGRRAAATKRILDEALTQLGESAPLTLRNLTFCTDVYHFGSFAAVKSAEFSAGQKVLLYAEVDNLHTESSAKGYRWAVKIDGQIFDGHGNRLADCGSSTAEETYKTPRHDFFVSKLYYLPRLVPGRYTLQLTIEDTLGHKVGQSSIDFTIKAE